LYEQTDGKLLACKARAQRTKGIQLVSPAEGKNNNLGWVHNNLALKHMRSMKKGDQILYYHTGDERQAVGIMTITSNPYPNPKEDNERFIVVDVKFKKQLKKPVTLEQMKKEKSFKDWELLRIGRLSVMPVPRNIWDKIIKMSQ